MKISGLDPNVGTIRLNKRMVLYYDTKRQTWIARAKQTTQGADTPARKASRKQFAAAVKLIKYATPEEMANAINDTKGTGWMPRDYLMAAAYGTLVHAYTTDGKLIRGVRTLGTSIQAQLDSISSTLGAILYRNVNGWQQIDPGTDGQTLVYNGPDKKPVWADVSLNISDMLDTLGSAEGDMLLRGSSGWVVLPKGTSNQVLTIDATTGDPVWKNAGGGGGGAPPFHPGFTSGRYYSTPASDIGTRVVSSNQLYAMPFYCPADTTFTEISCNAQFGDTGKSAELGIYTNLNGVPDTLEYDCGTVSVSGSGQAAITGLSLLLTAGWHFLVFATDGAPWMRGAIYYESLMNMLLGYVSPTSDTSTIIASWTFAAGSLPTTFPSSTVDSNVNFPLVYLRL